MSSCKYLGIILRSDLSWADQVNYTAKKAWKALHFTMRTLKKGNSNTKILAYTSLVRLILEYGAACWDPYREGTDKCDRQGSEESGQICILYEQTELGNWRRVESYHAYVLFPKRTLENGRGRLRETYYNGHII